MQAPKSKNLVEILRQDKALIKRYLAKEVSAADIGALHGYTPSYVLTTLSRLGIKRKIDEQSTYQSQKKAALLAKTRREFRAFLASKVAAGTLTLQDAAKIANCSERTIFRYIARKDQEK